MNNQECEVCQLQGYSMFRVPGILFHALPDACGFRIERCDSCARFASDEAAETAVKDAVLRVLRPAHGFCVRCGSDAFLLERQEHLNRDWGSCRFCGHADGFPLGVLSGSSS